MSVATEPVWRQRASLLGWVTIALFALSLTLLALAVALVLQEPTGDRGAGVGTLPMSSYFSRPGVAVFLAVATAAGGVFVGIAALETASSMRVLARDRRIPEPLPQPVRRARNRVLGPIGVGALRLDAPPHWPVTAVPGDPERVRRLTLRSTVLIPAHNEASIIGATLTSLRAQTRPPDRVIVIADNCSDDTVAIAKEHGVEVVETSGNTEKKAGALNQVLGRLLPESELHDVVLVMDADSTIADGFLEVGLRRLEQDPDLMAVGGLFFGEEGGGLVGQFQRNEYTRYQRLVARSRNRVYVLTGTASLVRAFAMRAVAEARGTLLPGPPAKVYDTLALTEDNELTLALKTLGAKMVSPSECRVTTEIMTSWRGLWRQRLRWHRGALENIGAYGVTRATALYWGQQLGLAYGVIALNSYFAMLLITLLAADSFGFSWFWGAIALIFFLDRVVTVWAVGPRGRWLAAPVIIELGYVAFLQACFVSAIVQMASGRQAGWNYVPREPGG